jgi:hypothetical protein
VITAGACGRAPADYKAAAAGAAVNASEGIVAPLGDDASDDIVSWVDGQVVKDWSAEVAKRDDAIERYVNDSDPMRAAKLRSGM